MSHFFRCCNPLSTALAAGIIAFASASAGAQTFLGPLNPGAEEGNANWFTGTSGTGFSSIDSTDPASGLNDFELGATSIGGSNNADWRAATFNLGDAAAGAAPVEFSFKYKIPGPVAAGENIRVDLRFFFFSTFMGEQNIFIGSDSGDTGGMNAYRTFTMSGITVPGTANVADIRFSANLFDDWSAGPARFDDFSVTVPEPASVSMLMGAAMLLRRRR